MARNGSGTYSLPAGNPVTTGTTITSSWANTTLSDLRDELTDSLSRSAKGGMLAQLKAYAGTVGAPGVSFSTETNSGLYRAGAGDLRVAIGGADVLQLESTGATVTGDLDVSGDIPITATGTTTARNIADREASDIWVEDFNAANDGTGDQATALQAAIDYAAANHKGTVRLGPGVFAYTGELALKGVNLVGSGDCHYGSYAGSGAYRGTILLCTPDVSGDCVRFDAAGGYTRHYGMRDLSIYADGAADFNAIVNISGVNHPYLTNVEMACMESSSDRGIGLLLGNDGTDLTLYGSFVNVVAQNCHTALKIWNDSNANAFVGGWFNGRVYCLLLDGDTAYPVANAFLGTSFESTFNSDQVSEYFSTPVNSIRGWSRQSTSYATKFVRIRKGRSTAFLSCYFENASTTTPYNWGSGSAPNASCISLDPTNPNDVVGTAILSARMSGCYLHDEGLLTQCDTLPDLTRYSTGEPAVLSVRSSNLVSVATATYTKLDFDGTRLIGQETQVYWDNSTGIGTFMEPGVYQIQATTTLSGVNVTLGYAHLRITAAGVQYYGPNVPKLSATIADWGLTASTTVKVVAGDTFFVEAYQNGGASFDTIASAAYTYLNVVKVVP